MRLTEIIESVATNLRFTLARIYSPTWRKGADNSYYLSLYVGQNKARHVLTLTYPLDKHTIGTTIDNLEVFGDGGADACLRLRRANFPDEQNPERNPEWYNLLLEAYFRSGNFLLARLQNNNIIKSIWDLKSEISGLLDMTYDGFREILAHSTLPDEYRTAVRALL